MRVLCHAQHLTGVGHFVIAHNIARGLAKGHDVYLVKGGRPVPRRSALVEPRSISLPILHRSHDGQLVAEDGRGAGEVLARRAELLADAARDIRPDVVLVDHYPFSKWELQSEISAAITAARAANPRVQVVCSLRDIAPRTRYEDMTDDEHAARVVEFLGEWFDALLVHADPKFVRLEEHFSGAADVPVALTYTGFVTESLPPAPSAPHRWAVASGGGADATAFLVSTIRAFRRLAASGVVGDMRLQVFCGLAARPSDRAALDQAAGSGPVDVHGFSPSFLGWLHGAALSMSRAGYNTTTALLRARVPAVVVPGPRLSDQRPRAQRLAAAGLAVVVDSDRETDTAEMADAMDRALSAPTTWHTFDLDGVAATRRFLESGV